MKRIKWVYLSAEVNYGTDAEPNIKQIFVPKDFPYSEEAEEAAKREVGDNYEIYDDGQPEPTETPNQLDVIEAQVTYTAMMTDTLLEV